jgi:hypothetical protein
MMADPSNRLNWARPEQHHWVEEDWRRFVVPDGAPGLLHWAPGEDLPEVRLRNHLAPFRRRLAQRLVHAAGLPLMDRLRSRFAPTDRPQPITSDIQAQLATALGDLP